MVAILVPPSIFQEVPTVFDPPVIADMPQEIRGGDRLGIEAGDEVSHIVREDLAVGGADLAIDAQG